jgi:hypothetical protein
LKKEWIRIAGERWRDFKGRLTKRYITNPEPDLVIPYLKYDYIKEEVWNEFVKSRDTPEFKVSMNYMFFVIHNIFMFSK